MLFNNHSRTYSGVASFINNNEGTCVSVAAVFIDEQRLGHPHGDPDPFDHPIAWRPLLRGAAGAHSDGGASRGALRHRLADE